MIQTILASTFGAMTILALAMIVWGFRSSFDSLNDVTRWFIKGFGFIALGYMIRGFYWDVFWQTLRYANREAASQWSEATGGTAINVVFYIIVLYGVYCVLKCREAMVPPDDRPNWPWYKAWSHPDGVFGVIWVRRRN